MDPDPFTATLDASQQPAHGAWRGNMSTMKYFLERYGGLEEPVGGRTPILWAVSGAQAEALDYLSAQGADIKKKTADGDNALACAVWSGAAWMVRRILELGFDPLEKNIHGKSALDWAEESGKVYIIQLVREGVGKHKEMLLAAKEEMLAIEGVRAEELQKKINAGARPGKLKIRPR